MYNLENYHKLKNKIDNVKRAELGFFPTKIYKLDNLSAKYGVNIYLRRGHFS